MYLISSQGVITESFELKTDPGHLTWETFTQKNKNNDIKYIKIGGPDNNLRCYISAIEINGNILTNRNSWLLSWGDLSSTHSDGNSNFFGRRQLK